LDASLAKAAGEGQQGEAGRQRQRAARLVGDREMRVRRGRRRICMAVKKNYDVLVFMVVLQYPAIL
jgi:hypothetical protein